MEYSEHDFEALRQARMARFFRIAPAVLWRCLSTEESSAILFCSSRTQRSRLALAASRHFFCWSLHVDRAAHVLWQNSQEFGAGSSKRRPREPTKIQFESAQDLRRSPPKTRQGNSNPNPRRDRDRQKTQHSSGLMSPLQRHPIFFSDLPVNLFSKTSHALRPLREKPPLRAYWLLGKM
jgi:hypothetical protein